MLIHFFCVHFEPGKCKRRNLVFEPHIKVRSRAFFERQTTAAPKAHDFLFSGSKPDKRRAAASAGSGKDKESAEAKELLKRVDERYNPIF